MRFNENKERFYCETGSPVKDVYSPVFDKEGRMELEVTGKENLYEYIQSHKDSVDIHVLLDRYANGELDVFEKRQGFYIDASEFPKTYAEMFQRISDAKEAFMQLPVDVRSKFEHSPEVWLSTFGSEDWYAKMSRPDSDSELVGSDSDVSVDDGEVKSDE